MLYIIPEKAILKTRLKMESTHSYVRSPISRKNVQKYLYDEEASYYLLGMELVLGISISLL